MGNQSARGKRGSQPAGTAWVYDDESGWINVNTFLNKIKKIEEELNKKLKKTG